MSQTISATYVNGMFKPKEPLALKEGTDVRLTIQPAEELDIDPDDPLAAVIGIGKSGRTDGADNHDHYIYGTAKRQGKTT